MRSRSTASLVFVGLVALLVFAAFGVAVACEWQGHEGDGSQLAETHLTLAADAPGVALGGAVTLAGQLSADAADNADVQDDDTGEAVDPGSGTDSGTDLSASAVRTPATADSQDAADQCVSDDDNADSQDVTPTPVPGAEIAIFQRTGVEAWSQVGTATTDDNGAFSVIETVNADTQFKAMFAGDSAYERARSRRVKVLVVADVTTPSVSGVTITANKAFVAKGRATRGAGQVTVTVFKTVAGRRVAVKSAKATFSVGAYRARLKLRAGTYLIGASQAGNSRIHAGSSGRRSLKVARH